MSKQTCPCCGGTLLHHLSNRGTYWLCQDCRQEMPILDNAASAMEKEDGSRPTVLSTLSGSNFKYIN